VWLVVRHGRRSVSDVRALWHVLSGTVYSRQHGRAHFTHLSHPHTHTHSFHDHFPPRTLANYRPYIELSDVTVICNLYVVGQHTIVCEDLSRYSDTIESVGLRKCLYCLSGGWRRWAMVSPDRVAPSRMVGVSASVNLPLQHKVLFWHRLTRVVPEKGP